jgi:hypothetical protein
MSDSSDVTVPSSTPECHELLIDAVIAPKLSFATHQNDVPVIRELKIVNLSCDRRAKGTPLAG